MRWKVRLDGSGLSTLVDDFADDPEIFEEGEDFYIWSSRFAGLDDHNDVRAEAKNIIRMIRNFGKLESFSVRDLEASDVYELLDDGTEHLYVDHGTAPIMLSPTGTTVTEISEDGTETVVHSPAKRTKRWTQLAIQDKKVEELACLMDHERSWTNIYKIYEFCEDNLPDGETPVKNGWISENKLGTFKHTANSRGAIGDEARHGWEGQPPSNPMERTEAKRLIVNIINEWLDYRENHTGAKSGT